MKYLEYFQCHHYQYHHQHHHHRYHHHHIIYKSPSSSSSPPTHHLGERRDWLLPVPSITTPASITILVFHHQHIHHHQHNGNNHHPYIPPSAYSTLSGIYANSKRDDIGRRDLQSCKHISG